MSELVLKEVIWGIVAIVFGLLQLWNRKAITDSARDAANKVEEVKKTLQASNEEILRERETVKTALVSATHEVDSKLNVIHALVNDQHGVALRLAAEATERLARLTGAEVDRQAAAQAKRLHEDHEAKQALADVRQQNQAKEANR